ncbi:MAG: phospholipase D-like domain-containing protein, partial [Rhodoferax sp.]|nr:phospholipase D-like domain-containing protein [Rhodoferax sp.]
MSNLRGGHQVQLLFRGEEFFSTLIDAVNAAVQEVRLETYIFHDDAIGEQVIAALVAAANRGVAVYLLVDGIGTPHMPPAWVAQLEQSGVQWRQFAPLGRLGLLIPGRWRRLHRKLCVVDRRLVFCGGINILDDHFQFQQGRQTTPRFDFAVQVQGPLVADAWRAMQQVWWRMQLARQVQHAQFDELRYSLTEPGTSPPNAAAQAMHTAPAGTVRAALLLRDNVRHRKRIERAYRRAIAQARDEVLIANAYFLPGRKLRLA